MNRRGFLRSIGLGIGGIALEQAIPLGRVWSFPKQIVLGNDAAMQQSLEFVTNYYDALLMKPEFVALQLETVRKSIPTVFEGVFSDSLSRLGCARIRSVDRDTHTIELDSIPS